MSNSTVLLQEEGTLTLVLLQEEGIHNVTYRTLGVDSPGVSTWSQHLMERELMRMQHGELYIPM